MSSPCDPQHAPVGDVSGALMMIDSQLKAVYDGKTRPDAEQRELVHQFAASLGPEGIDDLLDGACTLVYMYMQWLRRAYESHDKDVIEYVVPSLVGSMRAMTRSIRPEAVPTMAGLLAAAGSGLSPSLWRRQYGDWTPHEMTSLEATVFLLADHVNRLTEDRDFATRLVSDALAKAEAP
ncbi:hypothetical protein GCM10022244_03070 [Streptomyces gulbargensis]|uniref:Uncharacterized protein n=1 Tax=Streptomyces gulbargensis TaxID=364901 RepID=A0ABP7L7J3_9ACTN